MLQSFDVSVHRPEGGLSEGQDPSLFKQVSALGILQGYAIHRRCRNLQYRNGC